MTILWITGTIAVLGMLALIGKSQLELQAAKEALRKSRTERLIYKELATAKQTDAEDLGTKAIQDERMRIARDLHDSVSQSLFGMVYSLNGCLKMIDDQPDVVAVELKHILDAAENARADIRQVVFDIWPHELNASQFTLDLQKYLGDVNTAAQVDVSFDITGDFSRLRPQSRRTLYRVCQEALNNISKHAAAETASVCIDVLSDAVRMVIRDDGQGFDVDTELTEAHKPEQFGVRGMQSRVRELGGTCEIFSRSKLGTTIVVDLPVMR